MALVGNYSVLNKTAGQHRAGSSTAGAAQAFTRGASNKPSDWRKFSLQDESGGTGTVYKFAAHPYGYYPPGAWRLPTTAGAMAAHNRIEGAGALADSNLAGGRNGEAALAGVGDIDSADLALIVSAVAALSGTGALSADILGVLQAAAALAGEGDVTAALGALAGLATTLAGTGAVVSAITATGGMSAEITVTGTGLTTANVGAAVWSVIATAANAPGTMGEKLNDAGSAGNPWATIIESGLTAEEILRLVAAALAGKVSGAETTTVTIRDLGDTKDRIVATVDASGNRTAVVLDGS